MLGNRDWDGVRSSKNLPIDDTLIAKAGIKAGDYIVKIGNEQVHENLY